jgi:DNA polymerase-3 subunit delta'
MPFDAIIGQEKAKTALLDAIKTSRVAHAYLLHGPKGVGKETTAIAFAQALNCTAGDPSGCGECSSCKRIASFNHPDVRLIFPVPSGTPDDRLAGYREERLKDNPEKHLDFRTPAIISIDVIRRLITDSTAKPHEGKYKVFILAEAERMNEEASNAFLKTLEEPEGRSVFILTTSDPSFLKDTIISRCQILRFRKLSDDEIMSVLEKAGVEDPNLKQLSTKLAEGSAGRALALATETDGLDLMEERAEAIDVARGKDLIKSETFNAWVSRFESRGRGSRKRVLEFMLTWFRDLLLASEDASSELMTNIDLEKDIRMMARNRSLDELETIIYDVELARESVDRNVDPAYIFGRLLARIDSFNSRLQSSSARAVGD